MCLLVACGGRQEAVKPDGVLAQDVDPYGFYRSVSHTLLRTRQYMRATQTIRQMIKLRSADPEPYFLMARAYMGMQQYELAETMLGRALQRDRKYAPAISELGLLYNVLGRHGEADAFHMKAIELQPESASYHNNMGFSLYTQERYAEAVEHYLQALERDAASKRVHNNLGFAYGQLGQMDQAFEHFRLAGLPAQAHNNMGYLFEHRGELEQAYDFYRMALDDDPELVPARENLRRMCERLDRPLPSILEEADSDTEIDSGMGTRESTDEGGA